MRYLRICDKCVFRKSRRKNPRVWQSVARQMENDLVIPQYISKSSRFPLQAGENTTVSLVEVNQAIISLVVLDKPDLTSKLFVLILDFINLILIFICIIYSNWPYSWGKNCSGRGPCWHDKLCELERGCHREQTNMDIWMSHLKS